jgi:hypothetical protein
MAVLQHGSHGHIDVGVGGNGVQASRHDIAGRLDAKSKKIQPSSLCSGSRRSLAHATNARHTSFAETPESLDWIATFAMSVSVMAPRMWPASSTTGSRLQPDVSMICNARRMSSLG